MKKTKDEVIEEETFNYPTVESFKEEVAAPTPLAYDFGREDLNAMQVAVNYLLAKGK